MKVTPTHVEALRTAIEPLDTDDRRVQYRAGDFPKAELVKDLDQRYRWDLLWESGAYGTIEGIRDGDYKDTHIDTALRSIVKPL